MSGFDDFFPDEEEEQPPLPEAFTPDSQRATRSRADDVVDAVQGIRRLPPTKECPKCGSDNIVMRGASLGGNRTRKCRACGLEVPWATISSPVVQPPDRQVLSGPFYGQPKPKPSRNTPKYRQASEPKK